MDDPATLQTLAGGTPQSVPGTSTCAAVKGGDGGGGGSEGNEVNGGGATEAEWDEGADMEWLGQEYCICEGLWQSEGG